MNSIEDLYKRGWDINLRRQAKRISQGEGLGREWETRYVYEADKVFENGDKRYAEHSDNWEGYKSVKECVDALLTEANNIEEEYA